MRGSSHISTRSEIRVPITDRTPRSKTIVPAWARAKLTFRLVPDQTPEKIQKLIARQLRKLCPPTVRMEISAGHGGEPYLVSPRGARAFALDAGRIPFAFRRPGAKVFFGEPDHSLYAGAPFFDDGLADQIDLSSPLRFANAAGRDCRHKGRQQGY